MVYGLWSMVYGLWSMVYGLWSMVYGLWSMVYGLWSMLSVWTVYLKYVMCCTILYSLPSSISYSACLTLRLHYTALHYTVMHSTATLYDTKHRSMALALCGGVYSPAAPIREDSNVAIYPIPPLPRTKNLLQLPLYFHLK